MFQGKVFHGGTPLTNDKFEDVAWFSSIPIKYFGESHAYQIKINNPIVINADGHVWTDKLWWECCNQNGEPNIEPTDKRLTDRMPSFLWKLAQDSSDEIEYGDLPYILKNMYLDDEIPNDGVIIKQMYETPQANILTDVYVIFSMNQVEKMLY